MSLTPQDLKMLSLAFNDNVISDSVLDRGGAVEDYLAKLEPVIQGLQSSRRLPNADSILSVIAIQGRILRHISGQRNRAESVPQPREYRDGRYLSAGEQLVERQRYKTAVYNLADDVGQDILRSCDDRRTVYFPGGWHKAESGHAMQYKLQVLGGEYVLEVFNTGAGLDHHTQVKVPAGTDDYKEKVLTKKIYHIPRDKIRTILAELLKYQIIDVKEYKRNLKESVDSFDYAQELYAGLAAHSRISTTPELDAVARAQYSGTCSVRSFNEVLKELAKANYTIIKYTLRRQLLDEYSTKLAQHRGSIDKVYIEQLSHALHNFSGFINKQLVKLGEAGFNARFGNIAEIREYIKHKQEQLNQARITYSSETVETSSWYPRFPSFTTTSPKDIPRWNVSLEIRDLDALIVRDSFSMRDYTGALQAITDDGPYKRYHLIRILENIHKALDAYKLPKRIEDMDIQEFEALEKLLEIYQQIAIEIYGENPPARVYAFHRDIVKKIIRETSYFYQGANSSWDATENFLKHEPTNPCSATMEHEIDQRSLASPQIPRSTDNYKVYFTADIERILADNPRGIKDTVINDLNIVIDSQFRETDENRVWYVVVRFLTSSKEQQRRALATLAPPIRTFLEALIIKYNKIRHVRNITDTALARAQNLSAVKTNIGSLIRIEKYDERISVSSDFYIRTVTDLTPDSILVSSAEIRKAIFWGCDRYESLFEQLPGRYQYPKIEGNHNHVELYAGDVKLRGETESPITDISLRRLSYPYSNPQKAIDMLLSIFVGEDKKKLTELDYQQYFQHVLFTSIFLDNYFANERTRKRKFDYIQRYFRENLKYFNKDNLLSASGYLFNLRMLTFLGLYAIERSVNITETNQIFDTLLNQDLLAANVLGDIQPNPAQLYQICALRFVVLQAKMGKVGCTPIEQEELKKLYVNLYQNELEHGDSLDLNTRYQLDKALNAYYAVLPLELKGEIDTILKDINVDGTRPSLPYNLLHSSLFKNVFGKGVNFECTIENDGALVLFEDKKAKISYRALKIAKGYILQRLYQGKWYQYISSQDLAKSMRMPHHLLDKKHQYWIKTTVDHSLPGIIGYTAQKYDPDYCLDERHTDIVRSRDYEIINLSSLPDRQTLTRVLNASRYIKPNSTEEILLILNKLCLFEDINYIKICINEEGHILFKLVRYGIEFKIDTFNTGSPNVSCLTSPGYSLDLRSDPQTVSSDMLGVNNTIVLANIETGKKRILLPAQSCIPVDKSSRESSSTWPLLKLDTRCEVERTNIYIHDLDVIDSEKYYSCDVDDEQKITPGNCSEALYLAYLNLGQNNIPQAMHFLTLCTQLGGLNGSNEELRWIYSIIKELPWNDPLDLQPIPQRDGYEYIAARCKTLSLALTLIQSGRKWEFEQNPKSIPEAGSEKHKRFAVYKNLAMTLNPNLLKEYARYLKFLRKVPLAYRLSKDEELNILAITDHDSMPQALKNRLAILTREEPEQTISTTSTFDGASIPTVTLFGKTRAIADSVTIPVADYDNFSQQFLTFCEGKFVDFDTTISDLEVNLVRDVWDRLSETQKMAILARTSEPVTIDSLIKSFLNNESNIYGFSNEDTRIIYTRISYYLKLKVQLNALKDIKTQIEKTNEDREQSSDEQRHKYALNLKILNQLLEDSLPILQDRQIDCSTYSDRTILVFQAKTGICLRTKQLQLLRSLGEEGSAFAQMRMGGGKTKVLLPVLVKQKANSGKLPVVVVPKALFETNLVDLNLSTMKAFGQQGRAFVFNRSHAKTAAESLKILNLLKSTISNGDYIITTPDSVQSLDLKYFELLSSAPDPRDVRLYRDWESNLKNLEEILKIFKEQSDALIDEADLTFDIRKELQYATGEPMPYDADYIKYGSEMFAFLQKQTEILPGMTLINIILCSDDLDKTAITSALITKFIDDTESPIYKFLNKHQIAISPIVKQQLADFLRSKDAKYPDFSQWLDTRGEQLTEEDIDAVKKFLAFYAIQIHHLLPSTLNRKHNQHYGRPFPEHCSKPGDSIVAIPFEAAKKPKKDSRFSNILEEINYTYQAALLNNIPFEIGRLFVLELYVSCLSDAGLMATIQRILHEGIGEGEEAIDFSKINIENDSDISNVLRVLNKSNAFRLWCTAQYGLGAQTYNSHVLTSTAITHACAYARTTSMTGTPWNLAAMHDKLKTRYIPDESGDEEVIGNLQNPEKTQVRSYATNKDNKTTIESIFACATTKTRTLIDIAGSFRDLSNIEVADIIAEVLHISNPEIKYVLFFDADNCLYALDVKDKSRKIKLPSTDKKIIASKLECEPDACFTYYDQQHTTGVDIKQMPDANALVLVDGHTLHRDVLQGVMRMRQLPENQTLTLLFTQQFENILQRRFHGGSGSAVVVQDVLRYAKEYEETFVAADKIKSLKAKYNNIYAQGLYQILNTDGIIPTQKHELFLALNSAYQTYLRIIDTSITRFFEPGDRVHTNILEIWERAVARIVINRTVASEISAILARLRVEVESCHHQILALEQGCEFAENAGQSMETQVEQIVEKTLMTETEMRKEMATADLAAFSHTMYFSRRSKLTEADNYDEIFPEIFKTTLAGTLVCVKASPNFLNMFRGRHPLYFGSKPVHKVAFFKNSDSTLRVVLITAEDALDIERTTSSADVAIVDLSHPTLPETFPDATYGEQFKILMAKVYFINGNFDLAIKFAPEWVIQHREALYELATKHLKNVRQTTMAYIVALESDASLAQCIKRMRKGKTQVKLQQVISEFALDALDPATREKIEQLEEAVLSSTKFLTELTALINSPEELINISAQIDKLQQAIQKYEKSVAELSAPSEILKLCPGHVQEQIEKHAKISAKQILEAQAKIQKLQILQDRISAVLDDVQKNFDTYNQILLTLTAELDKDLADIDVYNAQEALTKLTDEWSQSYRRLISAMEQNKLIITTFKPEIVSALGISKIEELRRKIETRKQAISATIRRQQQALADFDRDSNYIIELHDRLVTSIDAPVDVINIQEQVTQLQRNLEQFIRHHGNWSVEQLLGSALHTAFRAGPRAKLIECLNKKDDIETRCQTRLAELDQQIVRIRQENHRVDQVLAQYTRAVDTLNLCLNRDLNTLDDLQAYRLELDAAVQLYTVQYDTIQPEADNTLLNAVNMRRIQQYLAADATVKARITTKREQLASALTTRDMLAGLQAEYDALKTAYVGCLQRVTNLLADFEGNEYIDGTREELAESVQNLRGAIVHLQNYAATPPVQQYFQPHLVEIDGFVQEVVNIAAIAGMREADLQTIQDAQVARMSQPAQDAIADAAPGIVEPAVVISPIADKPKDIDMSLSNSNTAARWVLSILFVLSIATVATFTALLLLEILSVMICAITIVVSGIIALGLLISLLCLGSNDSEGDPPVRLELLRDDLQLAIIEPRQPDLIIRPGSGLHFMHRPVSVAHERLADTEQNRMVPPVLDLC